MNDNTSLAPTVLSLIWDELKVGQRARLSRAVTLHELQAFGIATGQPTDLPATSSAAAARARSIGILPASWAGALIDGFISTDFPGPGSSIREQTLRFHRPVRVGDSLTITIEVVEKMQATQEIRLQCTVVNQHNEPVLSGETRVRPSAQKFARSEVPAPTILLYDPESRLKNWVATLPSASPTPCAVIHPCDEASLRGALDARDAGLITPIVVAPQARITKIAQQLGLSLAGVEILDSAHSHNSAELGVNLAGDGRVSMLMKGSLHTDELMEAVLNCPRLRTERRMSHVFRFDVPSYDRPLLLTDAAINISPSLADKADIARNAISLAHALGIEIPRLAILSAVETVTPKIASTIDAAALCKMAERGQITGGIIDGPLAFDNAISLAAARIKGIESPVAGRADILLVPDLEAGNMLAKQLEYLAGAASCGIVLGARVPIVLTSRADPAMSRVASAALARVMLRHLAEKR